MICKDMIYTSKRLVLPEIIATGEYKGFTYYVLNMGTHPCAYVDVTNTNLDGKDYSDIDIECHCGLTYAREYLNTVEKKGWFIGWDYAHWCDFVGYELAFSDCLHTHGKKWTTEEIVDECKNVIDQIKEKYIGEDTNVPAETEDATDTKDGRKKTNFDRIKEMSVEEFSEFLCKLYFGEDCPPEYAKDLAEFFESEVET